jgi:hypothetical protein
LVKTTRKQSLVCTLGLALLTFPLTRDASAQDAVANPTQSAEALAKLKQGGIRLELVQSRELMVLQEMLAGGTSPVQVVADLDTDVLAIPAQALVDAMDTTDWSRATPAPLPKHDVRPSRSGTGNCALSRERYQKTHAYPYRPKVPYRRLTRI